MHSAPLCSPDDRDSVPSAGSSTDMLPFQYLYVQAYSFAAVNRPTWLSPQKNRRMVASWYLSLVEPSWPRQILFSSVAYENATMRLLGMQRWELLVSHCIRGSPTANNCSIGKLREGLTATHERWDAGYLRHVRGSRQSCRSQPTCFGVLLWQQRPLAAAPGGLLRTRLEGCRLQLMYSCLPAECSRAGWGLWTAVPCSSRKLPQAHCRLVGTAHPWYHCAKPKRANVHMVKAPQDHCHDNCWISNDCQQMSVGAGPWPSSGSGACSTQAQVCEEIMPWWKPHLDSTAIE